MNYQYSRTSKLYLSLLALAIITPNWLAPVFAKAVDGASYEERFNSLANSNNYLGAQPLQWVNCWPTSRMPIKVYAHAGDVPGYQPQYIDFLKVACKRWTEASDGQITFTLVDQRAADGIEVIWKPRFNEKNGKGGEGGLCQIDPDDDGIKGATVFIYTYPNDKSSRFSDDAVMAASIHELGHALGIQGHSPTSGDIMCATTNLGDVNKTSVDALQLSQRDKNTILCLLKLGPRRADDVVAAALAGKHWSKEESELVNRDLITKASADIRNGNFEAAVQKLDKCLESEPNNKIALMDMESAYISSANQLFDQQQYAKAADMYAKSMKYLDRNTRSDNSYLASVLTTYLYCLQQSGNDADAQKVQARLHEISGVDDSTTAKSDSGTPYTKHHRGRSKTNSHSEMVAQTMPGIDSDGLSHDACINLNNAASSDILAGKNQAAIEKLEKCLQMEPGYARASDNLEVAYYNLGLELYNRQDYSGAVNVLAKALNCLDKQDKPEKGKLKDVLKAYALCLQRSGNDGEAQKAQERLDKISAAQ